MCGRGGFDPAGHRTSDKRKTKSSATTVTVEGSSADRAGHKVLARGAEARMVSAFLRPLQKKLKVLDRTVIRKRGGSGAHSPQCEECALRFGFQ